MSDVSTYGASREEIIEAGRKDLNFFAALCLGEVYEFPFPPLYLALWSVLTGNALKVRGQEKYALGLPRGFAKTTLLKILVVWLILYTDRKFFLIVCNTAGLAANFVSDVADILSSDNIVAVYGNWRHAMEKDTEPLKKTHFRGRPVIIAALGSNSSLRGLNLKFVRPDVMIMDDMQSREEAASPVESKKNIEWMLGTLLKANNKRRCLFMFVGNMYPYEGSILKKLKKNGAWTSFITGALLEDGESLWPDLRTVEDILEELENDTSMGHPEIFFSEVMNDEEAGNKAGIDITKIKSWPYADNELEADGGMVIIDPSAGKKKSDNVAIGAVRIFTGKPVLWELAEGRFNPKDQINESFKLAMSNELPAIVVEAVAYQSTLAFWMTEAMKKYGLHGMQILEILPNGLAKNTRIMDALKLMACDAPEIYLHSRVRSRVIYQIVHWDPIKTNNQDDVLDVIAYIYPTIQQYGHALTKPILLPADTKNSAAFSDDLQLEF